jgi:hypothetical protein
VTTPQTPTFPQGAQVANANGAAPANTPLSPGAGTKEKERIALLLELNQELLYETLILQQTKEELRKEQPNPSPGSSSMVEIEKDYMQ